MTGRFIPPHGGYEDLLSFQKARIVYDGTVWFCKHYLERRDRTNDQMVQAARSGKQNILEGSQASGTSKATEIKLTNVARASLEELLEDYRDFLRVRGLEEWTKEHPYTVRLRQLNRQPNANYETFRKGIENSDPAIAANVMIGLIKTDELSAGPANSTTGESICRRGRPARTYDPGPTYRKSQTEQKTFLILIMRRQHDSEKYELSDAEKRDLIKLINAGKPLPEKYRFLLFEDKREVELVWNGKTREVCTAILSFQTLEHIDEPRKEADQQNESELFDTRGRQLKGWTNKLIWGDNKLIVMFEDRWTGSYIFENEWQSFRTRKNRDLELVSASHTYEKPGRYTIAVKVIDIFGNDTMTLVPVNVS